MNFILSAEPRPDGNYRVILDEVAHGGILEYLEADNWIAARESIHPDRFRHEFGHGYMTETAEKNEGGAA